MIFTDKQVWEVCKKIAPIYDLDPYLVMAICEQECDHYTGKRPNRKWDITQYDCSIPRMEPAFYDRYIRDMEYSTCAETLLAASYGVIQMMGESLRKCKDSDGKNYFEWWFEKQGIQQDIYKNPMDSLCVINALDHYCIELEIMIDWGCKWFCKKLAIANGDIHKALIYWNGRNTYPDEVLARLPTLKKKFSL